MEVFSLKSRPEVVLRGMTTHCLLTKDERNKAVSLFTVAMADDAGLPIDGYLIHSSPFQKTLHLEEFQVRVDDEMKFLVSLCVRDGTGETIGCFPISDSLLVKGLPGIQKAVNLLRTVPNSKLVAEPTPEIPFPRPPKNELLLAQSKNDSTYISSLAAQVGEHVFDAIFRGEDVSYILTFDWREAKDVIEMFRPWYSTKVPFPCWWERRRVNHVSVFHTIDDPTTGGKIDAAHTVVVLPASCEPKSMDHVGLEASSVLMLESPTHETTVEAFKPIRAGVHQVRRVQLETYVSDVTQEWVD